MKKIIQISSAMFLMSVATAQELTIDAASITVQNQASMTVQGSVLNKTNGTIDNSGLLQIRNDITNNGGNTMLINGSNGTVVLNGDNQFVGGNDTIAFYDLQLSGTFASTKELYNSIAVTNTLDLNDQELQMHNNQIYVTNTDVNSITYNDGFVSGDTIGGYLYRYTNTVAAYDFPVGGSTLIPERRMVLMTPTDANTNIYGVRLSTNDASNDYTGTTITGASGPFDRSQKGANISAINDLYYHNIVRMQGTTPVDIEVQYASGDGAFQTLTQWKNNQFEDADFSIVNTSNAQLPEGMQKSSVSDFDHDVFALSELEIEIIIPGGVSDNDDGYNDAWVIEGLKYFPENEVMIFNRWGDKVFAAKPYLNDWKGDSNVSGSVGGNKVVAGTYYYMIKLKPEDDFKTGYIELKR